MRETPPNPKGNVNFLHHVRLIPRPHRRKDPHQYSTRVHGFRVSRAMEDDVRVDVETTRRWALCAIPVFHSPVLGSTSPYISCARMAFGLKRLSLCVMPMVLSRAVRKQRKILVLPPPVGPTSMMPCLTSVVSYSLHFGDGVRGAKSERCRESTGRVRRNTYAYHVGLPCGAPCLADMNSAAHQTYLDNLGHPTWVVNKLLSFYGHLLRVG